MRAECSKGGDAVSSPHAPTPPGFPFSSPCPSGPHRKSSAWRPSWCDRRETWPRGAKKNKKTDTPPRTLAGVRSLTSARHSHSCPCNCLAGPGGLNPSPPLLFITLSLCATYAARSAGQCTHPGRQRDRRVGIARDLVGDGRRRCCWDRHCSLCPRRVFGRGGPAHWRVCIGAAAGESRVLAWGRGVMLGCGRCPGRSVLPRLRSLANTAHNDLLCSLSLFFFRHAHTGCHAHATGLADRVRRVAGERSCWAGKNAAGRADDGRARR